MESGQHQETDVKQDRTNSSLLQIVENAILHETPLPYEIIEPIKAELDHIEKNDTTELEVCKQLLYEKHHPESSKPMIKTLMQELVDDLNTRAEKLTNKKKYKHFWVGIIGGNFRDRLDTKVTYNGYANIFIGTDTIRKHLIEITPKNRLSFWLALKWGIAHEIGHNYVSATWYNIKLEKYFLPVLHYLSIASILRIFIPSLFFPDSIKKIIPCKTCSIGLFLLFNFLHHKIKFKTNHYSEFAADKFGAQITDGFTPELAKIELGGTNTTDYDYSHPSSEERIARLQKVYDEIHAPQTRPK